MNMILILSLLLYSKYGKTYINDHLYGGLLMAGYVTKVGGELSEKGSQEVKKYRMMLKADVSDQELLDLLGLIIRSRSKVLANLDNVALMLNFIKKDTRRYTHTSEYNKVLQTLNLLRSKGLVRILMASKRVKLVKVLVIPDVLGIIKKYNEVLNV